MSEPRTRFATIELGERKSSPDGLKRFSATLSTETPVRRRDYDGDFDEVLSHARGAVSWRTPLPLLESHNRAAVNVGLVQNLRLDGDRLRGDVVFGKSARGQELAADAEAGIVTGLSVGYAIEESQRDERSTPPRLTATLWKIHECSVVGIPADENAGIGRGANMSGTKAVSPTTPETAQRADPAEQARVDYITRMQGAGRLTHAEAVDLVGRGVSTETVRETILNRLAAESDALPPFDSHVRMGDGNFNMRHGHIEVGETASEKFIRGASAWLFERSGSKAISEAKRRGVEGFDKLDLNGAHFRGLTLSDIARESLERQGVRTRGMARDRMVGLALTFRSGYATTSDFGVLLENVLNKTLQASYETQDDIWSKFCGIKSVSDFRDHHFYRTGSFGVLDPVAEHGEFKNKAIPDGEKVSVSAATAGNIIAISRQAIVNDDMGSFVSLMEQLGAAARLTIEQAVFDMLSANSGLGPTMSDAQPFFHANRANVGVSAALSIAAIDADAAVMDAQTDHTGNSLLSLQPSVLLVPRTLKAAAKVLNASAWDHDSTKLQKPNAVQNLFSEVIGTTRLSWSTTRRYLFCSPSIAPAFAVSFLEGQRAPFLEQQDGWRVDGTEMKVRLDYGLDPFDPRGAVSNAGT